MTRIFFFLLAVLPVLMSSCASSSSGAKLKQAATAKTKVIPSVRTTAYTHTEADHIIHGTRTAVGSDLKFGKVRSAAADWSVYPVGTVFQIEGTPYVYQVDDYGSALVGTNTIDLYKPDKKTMNQWGVRRVNIKVLKWGSFAQSLNIMKPRADRYQHVRKMVQRIEKSS
jgi:3D (Asp-Asp-Asp) domain-containing protein